MNDFAQKDSLQMYLLGQILLGCTIWAFLRERELTLDVHCQVLPDKESKKNIFILPTPPPKVPYLLLHFSGFIAAERSYLISKC